jgi:hypothetical protein
LLLIVFDMLISEALLCPIEDFTIPYTLVINNTDIKYLSPLGTLYLINIYQKIFLAFLRVIYYHVCRTKCFLGIRTALQVKDFLTAIESEIPETVS